MDVPIFLNSVSSEEDYEGDFYGNRRSIIFTLNFTMKTYIFGAQRSYKEIRDSQMSLLNAPIFDDHPINVSGSSLKFADVFTGICGPSGASSGIGNYDAWARIYQPLSGGGTTYAAGMGLTAGGITVDWNF